MSRSTVLVLSPDPSPSHPVLSLFQNNNTPHLHASDLDSAAAAIQDPALSLMILNGCLDFCKPFFSLIADLRLRSSPPPLLVVARSGSEDFAVASLRAGAVDYLTEPLDLNEFSNSISRWVPLNAEPFSGTELNGGEILVGSSPAMQFVRLQIRRIAATDCNVLITGETGTGKELVAQLIHQNSKRSGYPLICINCAAIPDSLLESELFGYERGAFTGANSMSPGKLMSGNKGTIFFDEIGDMSPCAQAKILRAIESKEVQRLGATRKYESDVRILAATHHNLDELASAQTFRRDLYFRLNVGRIHLPPLRERRGDVAGLVERMVLEFNQKVGRRIEGVTEKAIRMLVHHDWPGNIRELKNVIERIFIMRDNGRITEEDLLPVLGPGSAKNQSRPEEELQNLRAALVTCNGNRSKAAEQLNCSRMTLYRKMAKYGIGGAARKALSALDHGNEFPRAPRKLA